MASSAEARHESFFSCLLPEKFVPDWKKFYEEALEQRGTVQKDYAYWLHRAYGPAAAQVLNVYSPSERPGGLAPVIIFFHGGHWSEGHPDYYDHFALPWLKRGAVFISVGYRTEPEATRFQCAQDAAEALRWVAAHAREYGADPNQIHLSGHSAGGHLAALAALTDVGRDLADPPVGVAGLIFISGVTDTANWGSSDALNPALHLRRAPGKVLIAHGVPEENMVGQDTGLFGQEGHMLHTALLAFGANPRILGLPDTDHLQTAMDFADPESELFAAARKLVFDP